VCPGLGFRVSALNHVCPSVRSISYWLEDCLTCDWTEGRKGGEFSLTHKHKWGGEFSLTHTHTLKSGGEFSLTHTLKSGGELTFTHTHWNREVSSHSHTHTKWGGEFSLTHALKLGGDFSPTHSNEKVSLQSLTHPRSFTCVNGFTYSLESYKIWRAFDHRFHIEAMQTNTVNSLFVDMRTDVDLRGLDPRKYLIFILMLK
jgi:hypothetical protein